MTPQPGKQIGRYRPARQNLIIFSILALIGLSAAYAAHANYTRGHAVRNKALHLAETAKIFLSADLIHALGANESGPQVEAYRRLRDGLLLLKNGSPDILYAYLNAQDGDGVRLLADSRPQGSGGHSATDSLNGQVSEAELGVLTGGAATVTDIPSDAGSGRVRALTPITDPSTGKVAAVLGLDCRAEAWAAAFTRNTENAMALSALSILLLAGLYRTGIKGKERERLVQKLNNSEALSRAVIEQAPFGVGIIRDYSIITMMNGTLGAILGRTREELNAHSWADITHPDDREASAAHIARFRDRQEDSCSLEMRFLRASGESVWTRLTIFRLLMDSGPSENLLCILEDIQDRKQVEEALKESERSKSVLLSHLPGMAYRCLNDRDWTMLFVSAGCHALTGYPPPKPAVQQGPVLQRPDRSGVPELPAQGMGPRSDGRHPLSK